MTVDLFPVELSIEDVSSPGAIPTLSFGWNIEDVSVPGPIPKLSSTRFAKVDGHPDVLFLDVYPVDIELTDEGLFIASDNWAYRYGVGKSENEAVDEFFDSLIEYFVGLERESEKLGYLPREDLRTLKKYLRLISRAR